MSHGFSTDLRCRVVAVISEGLSTRKAAARFGVGVSTAGEWYRRYRDNGETAARKQGQPPGSKLDAHLVEQDPDISLGEIAGQLLTEYGVSAAPSTVWEFFDRRDITYKKRRRMRVNNSALT